MHFFNRNWAGACEDRWVGPRLLMGRTGGCWIDWAGVGSLQCWSIGSGCGTLLQEEPKGRRVGEDFARGRSDA